MKSAAVMKTVTGPSTRCIHSPAIVTLKSEWEVGFAMMMTMMSYPTRQKERKKKKKTQSNWRAGVQPKWTF